MVRMLCSNYVKPCNIIYINQLKGFYIIDEYFNNFFTLIKEIVDCSKVVVLYGIYIAKKYFGEQTYGHLKIYRTD
jgi:hypothetical protein